MIHSPRPEKSGVSKVTRTFGHLVFVGTSGNTDLNGLAVLRCCLNVANDPSLDSEYMFMPADTASNQLFFCDVNGGRLAHIETIAENDCINQYIQEGESDSGSDGMLRTWM